MEGQQILRLYGGLHHFQQYLSYFAVVSFIVESKQKYSKKMQPSLL
jgi:hypothetical protein